MLHPLQLLQGARVATVFEVTVPRGALLPAISFYVTVPRSGALASFSLSLLYSELVLARLQPQLLLRLCLARARAPLRWMPRSQLAAARTLSRPLLHLQLASERIPQWLRRCP